MVVRYKADWHRNVQQRVIRRPRPIPQLPGLDIKDCSEHSLRLFSLFMPIASRVYLSLFSAIFGDGQASVNLKSLSGDAVYDSANEVAWFKKAYKDQRNTALPLYLTGFKSDSWDFHLGSVKAHGLSGFLDKEGTNLVRSFFV